MAALLIGGTKALRTRMAGKRFLLSALLFLSALLVAVTGAFWNATAAERALASYEGAEYNRSAELFETMQSTAARYNAANAWYRAGEYERALQLYRAVEAPGAEAAARVWFNRGNTLVRLKEFAKARDAYARSLALHYDAAALENMMHILYAEEQDHMLTGRQEGKKRVQEQEEEGSQEQSGRQKEGGGSNQQSAAERNRGAGSQGKKVEREAQLEFSNKGSSRLSSKQYELINRRSVHETKPW
jgi:Ca-activated chloride channel family protein